MRRRRRAPLLGGVPVGSTQFCGEPIYADCVGYVQYVDVDALQACAEASQARVQVAALPGTFAAPGVPLAYLQLLPSAQHDVDRKRLAAAFLIGDQRQFEEDPRFGLVVLSEIAGRALSPAVNDVAVHHAGTALARARLALDLPQDVMTLESVSAALMKTRRGRDPVLSSTR